jgi:hypothetical protein
MKTVSASIFVLVLAITICSTLLPGGPKTSTAAQPLGPGDSTAGAGSLEQQIVSKEREGLDALKTGNLELFANLTADNAVYVDTHGPASKAQVLQNVAGFKLLDYSMKDVKLLPLSAKSGLITYKINEKGVSHGREFAVQVYVSSIWTKRKNKWVCVFSQETAAK